MRPRWRTFLVVAGLILAGVAAVGARLYAQHQQRLAGGDSLWRVTYSVEFQAEKPGARLLASEPDDTPHVRVFRQDVLYSEMATERLRRSQSESREISLTATAPGEYRLMARFDLRLSRDARWPATALPVLATPAAQAAWLRATPTIQTQDAAVVQTLQRIQQGVGTDGLLQRIFEHCRDEIELEDESEIPQDAASAIERKAGSPLGKVLAMTALCRAAKIPARVVTGFEIREDDELAVRHWLEVLEGGRWTPFDPAEGYARELPYDLLPVRRDGAEIVRGSGLSRIEPEFTVMRLPPGSVAIATQQLPPIEILNLTRLPLPMHAVLSLILLLPFGALVTAIFRTVIGIRTFGTFTPTLIALSFVFADWRTGLVVFALVLTLGLTSRSLLDRLKLLMVPRLSFVLTIVVLLLVFAVSTLDYVGWTPSAQAVLLPMVILTMTVERLYLTTEEDGIRYAMHLLANTMLLAGICYCVLRWQQVGAVLLAFPELHLFTLAALVLIGRYTGYRLTELWRFRDLANRR